MAVLLQVCVSERETGNERERERETEREGKRERDREGKRETGKEKETEREKDFVSSSSLVAPLSPSFTRNP